MMKKFTAFLVSMLLMVSLTACGSSSKLSFKAGTYVGEANGYHGPVKVSLVVSDKAISDITVEHDETKGLGDEAIKKIVADVKKNESLDVDLMSGATYSSKAVLEALTIAFSQSGVDMSLLTKKESGSAAKAQDEEKTTDVVVIGGGGAGLAAAVSAHQNGAKVIVLEKMPSLGGNTIIAGSAFNVVDPDPVRRSKIMMTDKEKEVVEKLIAEEQKDEKVKTWQAGLKADYDEYKKSGSKELFDSIYLHMLQTYNGGDKIANVDLIETFAKNGAPTLHWLESLDMKFKDYVFTVLGGMWSRAHKPEEPLGTGFINTYKRYLEKNSADMEVLLNTKATELIVKDGAVVGVKSVASDGHVVTIMATKGVVLATGGFGANEEMREAYNKHWKTLKGLKTTNQSGATGDGIELAKAIDADLVGMEYIQLLPMGDPKTGSLSGNIEQGVQNRLFVNKEGRRFVDEGARRDVMTKALIEQTDASMWVIVDKHSYESDDTVNNFNESMKSLMEQGRAFKADTLEELAKQIGVDGAALVASVNEFNDAVDGKVKDPFGRVLFDKKIDTPPYYAGARVPTVHHTMGGVKINTLTQVIDTKGAIIKGLYACGEVTGGLHGSNRLGGNALSDIAIYGKIAGESAALAK